jgi:hypothetical protein
MNRLTYVKDKPAGVAARNLFTDASVGVENALVIAGGTLVCLDTNLVKPLLLPPVELLLIRFRLLLVVLLPPL